MKIANPHHEDGKSIEKMVTELDGCEIRTGQFQLIEKLIGNKMKAICAIGKKEANFNP